MKVQVRVLINILKIKTLIISLLFMLLSQAKEACIDVGNGDNYAIEALEMLKECQDNLNGNKCNEVRKLFEKIDSNKSLQNYFLPGGAAAAGGASKLSLIAKERAKDQAKKFNKKIFNEALTQKSIYKSGKDRFNNRWENEPGYKEKKLSRSKFRLTSAGEYIENNPTASISYYDSETKTFVDTPDKFLQKLNDESGDSKIDLRAYTVVENGKATRVVYDRYADFDKLPQFARDEFIYDSNRFLNYLQNGGLDEEINGKSVLKLLTSNGNEDVLTSHYANLSRKDNTQVTRIRLVREFVATDPKTAYELLPKKYKPKNVPQNLPLFLSTKTVELNEVLGREENVKYLQKIEPRWDMLKMSTKELTDVVKAGGPNAKRAQAVLDHERFQARSLINSVNDLKLSGFGWHARRQLRRATKSSNGKGWKLIAVTAGTGAVVSGALAAGIKLKTVFKPYDFMVDDQCKLDFLGIKGDFMCNCQQKASASEERNICRYFHSNINISNDKSCNVVNADLPESTFRILQAMEVSNDHRLQNMLGDCNEKLICDQYKIATDSIVQRYHNAYNRTKSFVSHTCSDNKIMISSNDGSSSFEIETTKGEAKKIKKIIPACENIKENGGKKVSYIFGEDGKPSAVDVQVKISGTCVRGYKNIMKANPKDKSCASSLSPNLCRTLTTIYGSENNYDQGQEDYLFSALLASKAIALCKAEEKQPNQLRRAAEKFDGGNN